MITVNVTDVAEYEKDLKAFAHRAFPFATKATINRAAFAGRDIAKDVIKGKMIERNRYTARSIQVEMARTLVVSRQEAVLGSTADYMETQEFGGTIQSGGKHGRPIATAAASGESSLPRRKLPRPVNRRDRLKLQRLKARKAKNWKQALIFAGQAAVSGGSRVVFLDLGATKGIYRIVGGSRRFKRGWPKGAKLRKLYDLSRRTVAIPARPWLYPATMAAADQMPEFYAEALVFQLRRQGILGY